VRGHAPWSQLIIRWVGLRGGYGGMLTGVLDDGGDYHKRGVNVVIQFKSGLNVEDLTLP
jgi:hypothetical protein